MTGVGFELFSYRLFLRLDEITLSTVDAAILKGKNNHVFT